ncbi:DUF2721 domain-containing protein [Natronogracilivirga saccharolytica]|uniref:DUF2721 domain-containing protein n=1 Tax=Natronogracilivirga saccharolytica TaxID=2812953 RepID=A0A8J7S864_9BACT|nr:DUF2721 domain-containing protein [Natronogracilivirga saccharolytica]MBP3193723.1 DUF2721 domain-containing protein [Natronogracilivirga saccharolytica]
MSLDLSTPALLFPAISLLLLAYTNRFLTLATLIRNLHGKYKEEQDPLLFDQIRNLKLRTRLIRDMQVLGVISLFLSALCMLLLFQGYMPAAKWTFGFSLVFLLASLGLSVWEIQISIRALNIQLSDMSGAEKTKPPV